MPIGFSDLLKTTAQLTNNLSKGIVSTDDTYGGVRSKIDDWTDLHTSTYNSGAAYTFQDDGSAAAPGHFKEYSTMFYVADGRALVEDASASDNFIRLDSGGNYVESGGTKYVVDSGDAEPEFWVLDDASQVGGTGSGTDKLPTFTITGTQGSDSTAIPAGYQKLQVLTNAASDPGGSGYNSTIGVDTDITTTGAAVIDTIALTDGVVVSDITTRNLTLGDLGYTGATDANNYVHPTQSAITVSSDTGALTGAAVISDVDIDISVDTLGHVTAATYTTATRNLTLGDLGYTGATDANNYVHPTQSAITVSSDTGALTGAAVISDIDIDLSVDTLGHVTAATYTTATRNLTLGDLGYTGATDANNYVHPTQSAITVSSDTGALTGAAVISDVDIDLTVDTLGHVTAATYTTATRNLTLGDLGYTGDTNAEANVATDLGIGTSDGSTQQITSSTGSNVNLVAASGTVAGIITTGAQTIAGNKTFSGNLTVTGDFISTTSTNVIFEDTFLDLNVPDTATADITTDSGLRFGTGAAVASTLDKHAQFMYDATADVFKFTREADAGDFTPAQAKSGADNVKALKFDVTTSSLGAEAAATNDLADLYGTAPAARSNDSNVRSIGAVSKCSIDITTDSSDDGSNYAPVAAASNGYPIQHDLNTSSVFVFALKTHQAGGDGSGGAATAIDEPQPVFCKFKVLSDDIVEVSVGITKENEKYDIIVIG